MHGEAFDTAKVQFSSVLQQVHLQTTVGLQYGRSYSAYSAGVDSLSHAPTNQEGNLLGKKASRGGRKTICTK